MPTIQKSEVRPGSKQNEPELFLVQMLRCQCGKVLHVRKGLAECPACRRRHLVRVETTQGVQDA